MKEEEGRVWWQRSEPKPTPKGLGKKLEMPKGAFFPCGLAANGALARGMQVRPGISHPSTNVGTDRRNFWAVVRAHAPGSNPVDIASEAGGSLALSSQGGPRRGRTGP